ncbi:carboxymuconolactone decarboxylase family protein [Herbaspirillum sp. GCM10030257]|uniref:carboxymuconolactone decarboxylase family protein n=1 Tax=Herbaspirillum sp. GCM10030257 TaxID=3273393 RepID=UPI00361A3F8A
MSASSRSEWSQLSRIAPSVEAALVALGKAASDKDMEPALLELVSLRASQINNCAFCVQYHLNAIRHWRLAVPREKIDLVSVWKEVDIYSPRERAALKWTEIITSLPENSVSDHDYAQAHEHFSEKELLLLTAAIGAVNVWNRIGVAFRFSPPVPNPDMES